MRLSFGLCGTLGINSRLRGCFLLNRLTGYLKWRCICRCGSQWLGGRIRKRWGKQLAGFARFTTPSVTDRTRCQYLRLSLLYRFSSLFQGAVYPCTIACVLPWTYLLYRLGREISVCMEPWPDDFINLKSGSARAFRLKIHRSVLKRFVTFLL